MKDKPIKIIRRFWEDSEFGCYLDSKGKIVLRHINQKLPDGQTFPCGEVMTLVDFDQKRRIYKCAKCGRIYNMIYNRNKNNYIL